jgi:hypothetical protein
MNDKPTDNKTNDTPTAVTKIAGSHRPPSIPLMSFTAVTSHQAMASAFVNELLRAAQTIIPDRELHAEDLVSILQRALYDEKDHNITLVSGRHLRSRISEQVSRAKRYNEPFSLIALNLDSIVDHLDYEAVVDTLRERMRQTDLIFLFRSRIVLLLPHTEKAACRMLEERIQTLLKTGLAQVPKITLSNMTFPNPELERGMDVLDWAENQLR